MFSFSDLAQTPKFPGKEQKTHKKIKENAKETRTPRRTGSRTLALKALLSLRLLVRCPFLAVFVSQLGVLSLRLLSQVDHPRECTVKSHKTVWRSETQRGVRAIQSRSPKQSRGKPWKFVETLISISLEIVNLA